MTTYVEKLACAAYNFGEGETGHQHLPWTEMPEGARTFCEGIVRAVMVSLFGPSNVAWLDVEARPELWPVPTPTDFNVPAQIESIAQVVSLAERAGRYDSALALIEKAWRDAPHLEHEGLRAAILCALRVSGLYSFNETP